MMKAPQHHPWLLRLFVVLGGLSWQTELVANPNQPTRPPAIFVNTASGTKVAVANEVPEKVKRLVYAANQIIGKPYKWGGGHHLLHDSGYDCSGAVSYVLSCGGLIPGSKHCREFLNFGRPGKGHWVTLYVSRTHIFMKLCGKTFDVCSNGKPTGPRWRPEGRSTKGFQARHLTGI